MSNMNDFDIGYCMDLIVGEGSFTGDKNAPSLAVKLHASDPLPLLKLQETFGGSIDGPYCHQGRVYRIWQLRGPELIRALPLLDRYLPDSKKRYQYVAWKEMRRLNEPAIQPTLYEIKSG